MKIRQVHSDILEFNEFKKYDMVVANFFLNVFYRETMTRVLEQLVRLGKPGAKIVVETDEQTDLPPVAGFDLLKDHHMGKTIVRIYQRAE